MDNPNSPPPSNGTFDLLFFGDLVGKPGRMAVIQYLEELKDTPDWPQMIVANVENATHGFGLNQRHYNDLMAAGVDIMTGGNHSWDRADIFQFIDESPNLFRPANFVNNPAGRGWGILDIRGQSIAIINLIGQVLMGNYNSPWEAFDQALEDLEEQNGGTLPPCVFVDFHAETTAEKIAFARHAAKQGISAFCGTHTHVQTADIRFMEGRMGYLTDAGFNGAYESVIGMKPECSIKRMKEGVPSRMEIQEEGDVQVNAVRFTLNTTTGQCHRVERVLKVFTLKNPEPLEAAPSESAV